MDKKPEEGNKDVSKTSQPVPQSPSTQTPVTQQPQQQQQQQVEQKSNKRKRVEMNEEEVEKFEKMKRLLPLLEKYEAEELKKNEEKKRIAIEFIAQTFKDQGLEPEKSNTYQGFQEAVNLAEQSPTGAALLEIATVAHAHREKSLKAQELEFQKKYKDLEEKKNKEIEETKKVYGQKRTFFDFPDKKESTQSRIQESSKTFNNSKEESFFTKFKENRSSIQKVDLPPLTTVSKK